MPQQDIQMIKMVEDRKSELTRKLNRAIHRKTNCVNPRLFGFQGTSELFTQKPLLYSHTYRSESCIRIRIFTFDQTYDVVLIEVEPPNKGAATQHQSLQTAQRALHSPPHLVAQLLQ